MSESTHLASRAGRAARRVCPPAGLDSDVDRVNPLAGQYQSVPGQDLIEPATIWAGTVVDVIGELLVPAHIHHTSRNTAVKWHSAVVIRNSYRAFVYIGNDGFCFAADCKHNNRKDKCRFLSVSK